MQKINFENLPSTSTPLNASNLNQLQTNIENAINLASDYSTSETIIGKWIDGKHIYRKSFYFTQWSGLGFDTSLENIDNIINASVLLKNTASGQWIKLACNPDGSYGFYIKKTENTYKIFISNENVYTADAVCAFAEYTKTTD